MVPLDVRIPAELDQVKTTTLGILRDHYQKKDEDEDWEQLSFPDLRGMLRGRIQFKGLKNDAVLNGFIKGWAADYLKRFADEEEMPEREYWEAVDIERCLRSDHSSSAVVGAKEKAVEVWGSVAKILRKCLAWREPESVDWSEWFRATLVAELTSAERRYLIFGEDAWVEGSHEQMLTT